MRELVFAGLLSLWIITVGLLIVRIDDIKEQREYIKWLEGELLKK